MPEGRLVLGNFYLSGDLFKLFTVFYCIAGPKIILSTQIVGSTNRSYPFSPVVSPCHRYMGDGVPLHLPHKTVRFMAELSIWFFCTGKTRSFVHCETFYTTVTSTLCTMAWCTWILSRICTCLPCPALGVVYDSDGGLQKWPWHVGSSVPSVPGEVV